MSWDVIFYEDNFPFSEAKGLTETMEWTFDNNPAGFDYEIGPENHGLAHADMGKSSGR